MANELSKAFRYGIDQPTENLATTLEALGFDAQARATRGLVDAPEDYESAAARFMNPEEPWYDFNWRDLPLATVEQAGQLGGSLISRAGGAALGGTMGPVGAMVGALLGPALFEAVQIAGPVALERARNNNREEPNAKDWTGALGASAMSGVLNAIGVKNIGMLNSTVGRTALAGVREGVTEGLQSITEQVGGTALTDKGLTIDPKQALGETFLGTSAGVTTQAPLAIGQAINNMRNTVNPPVTPGALPAPPVVEDPVVEDPTAPPVIFAGAIEDPAVAPVVPDLEPILSEYPVEDQDLLRQRMLSEIEAHPELYSEDNSWGDIMFSLAQDQYQLMQDATQSVVAPVLDDLRFEEPMRDQKSIYYNDEGEVYGDALKPRAEGIAGLMEQNIDPTFMTQGLLVPHLTNLPKKPMDAQVAMDRIGIVETDNWFRSKEGVSGNEARRVREAIDSGVAQLLRNRKREGKPVTRAEMEAVFNDHLASFKTYASRDEYGGDFVDKPNTEYQDSHMNNVNRIPGFTKTDNFELWTYYDRPFLPAGKYINPLDDPGHNPYGKGTNLWARGQVVDVEGHGPGLVAGEIQAQIHEYAQTPKRSQYVYRSQSGQLQKNSKMELIGAKLDRLENAKAAIADRSATEYFLHRAVDKYENSAAFNLNRSQSDVYKGRVEGQQVVIDLIEDAKVDDTDTELASYEVFREKIAQVDKKVLKDTGKFLRTDILREQPFEALGYTLSREDVDSFTGPAYMFENHALDLLKTRGLDLKAEMLAATTAEERAELQGALWQFNDLYLTANNNAERQAIPTRDEIIEDAMPFLLKQRPDIKELVTAAKDAPTFEERAAFKQYQGAGTEILLPDYPFPKNWPAMGLRTVILHGVDDPSINHVYAQEKGYEGAPGYPYKNAKKELFKIASELGLPSPTQIDTGGWGGGNLFQLDIRPIRKMIADGTFPGFKGYKHGGLVTPTKAQGAGYNINYADYGRSYK